MFSDFLMRLIKYRDIRRTTKRVLEINNMFFDSITLLKELRKTDMTPQEKVNNLNIIIDQTMEKYYNICRKYAAKGWL